MIFYTMDIEGIEHGKNKYSLAGVLNQNINILYYSISCQTLYSDGYFCWCLYCKSIVGFSNFVVYCLNQKSHSWAMAWKMLYSTHTSWATYMQTPFGVKGR